MNYILYNPISGHGNCKELAEKIKNSNVGKSALIDMTELSYSDFFPSLKDGDTVTVCGGDGTLNRFVNELPEAELQIKVFYYPSGTGNDFYADVCEKKSDEPIEITDYIKGLPTVKVNGKEHKFINGVGYGIDGYCCEIGDKMRAEGKVANYTAIAIKGLLFKFKPRNATVIVDGVEKCYKKVWIAPTMFGRHYGGGMIPTPNQSRDCEPKKLSLMLFHGSGKLKTLMIFPSIFKGEHVKHTECVEVLEGKNITVKFDRPTPLQIDGETVLGVTEYRAACEKR